MKTKWYFIIATVTLLMVIVATVYITNKIVMNRVNSEGFISEREQENEVIQDNSVTKIVKDPVDYEKLRNDIEEEMRKEFEASHQNPKKNEEYDKQVNEYVDFDIDPLPKTFKDIMNRTKKVVSMDYSFKDMREKDGYEFHGKVFYHYPYLDNPPRLAVEILDIDHKVKPRLKFDVTAYVGFNSGSASFGYEPLKWIGVVVLLNGQKIYVDKTEKLIINSLVGFRIRF
jgi:hypothetical protein